MANNITTAAAINKEALKILEGTIGQSYTYNPTSSMTLDAKVGIGLGAAVGGAYQNPPALSFHEQNEEIARLEVKDGKVVFSGSMDAAAKRLMEMVSRDCEGYVTSTVHDRSMQLYTRLMNALLHESTHELYTKEERLVVLTCLQRVKQVIDGKPFNATPIFSQP